MKDLSVKTKTALVSGHKESMALEYYACLERALAQTNSAEETVQALACYCRKAQLPEEYGVRQTMLRWVELPVGDDVVRRIFRVVYAKGTPKGPAVSQMGDKERTARSVRDFFERRYDLRFNTVKQQEEYREKYGQKRSWLPLTTRDLKRMAFEQMMEGGRAWLIDLENYVGSNLVRNYNPITEYLQSVRGCYDPTHDYIGELAGRVPTDYTDWERFFHRWLLAVVAQWTGRGGEFGNAVVPMLIGGQGTHKTTFCRQLLPSQLRDYYMDDIKMDNAEQVERVLGRMALVNIDEYNAKTDREQAKIKRLLTEKQVQVRRMRSDQYTLTPRCCSFIATTNDPQPLPGGDGTRRYLCVELKGVIDTDSPLDHRRLYAQALHEIEGGAPFRFFPDEEAAIQLHNRPYQQQSSAEECLLACFEPADRGSEKHFMRAIDIQQQLATHLRSSDVPNIKLLTITLRRCGFKNGIVKGQRGWFARIR